MTVPVNTVPSAKIVNEDTALIFSGLSVTDADDNLTSTQLTVAHGALSVDLSGGATLSAGANGSATLTLFGSQTQINAALATLSYLGALNFNGSDTLEMISSDTSAETSTIDTVAITVNAINDAAALSADSMDLTETDEPLSTGGTLTVSDVDSSEASFQAQTDTEGDYGIFNIDSAGVWTYVAYAAYDELAVDDSYTDTFTVESADGTTTQVTVNILGTDDAPTLSADVADLTETDEPLSTSGALTISDADNPDAVVVFEAQADTEGDYGLFNIDSDGVWSYAAYAANDELNEGDILTDTFTVTSADGIETSVTINILGANDAAILSADIVSLTQTDAPLSTGGALTVSDVDSTEDFEAQTDTEGDYGLFNINSEGIWSYVASSAYDELNAGDSLSDIFTVVSADGTATLVTVNILGANDAAVLSADVADLIETDMALSADGTLSVSDVDSTEAFEAQTDTEGNYGFFNIDSAGAWSYDAYSAYQELKNGEILTDLLTVTSADGTKTNVTINIQGVNDAPVLKTPTVITYTDAVFDDNFATLTGSLVAGDIDGNTLTYGINNGTDNGSTVSKTNAYGVLTVTKATGAYSFTANDAAIEALTAATGTGFIVTASDGVLQDSKRLTINLAQNGATESNGDDTLLGSSGNDKFDSLAGNDIINGKLGADIMKGGLGNDSYFVDNTGDVVTEASGAGIDTVNSAISYILGANLENLNLTGTAAINGTGNALNNVLTGNTAANTLNGGAGADSLVGGLGNDSYFIDNAGDVVTEASGAGTDTVNSLITYSLGTTLENLSLSGTAAINGTGNGLNNILIGNAGLNTLNGGTGADILQGGLGNDVLTGGLGKDIFQLINLSKDRITDFSVVDDTIQLENSTFAKLTAAGVLSAANFKIGAAADANDYVIYNSGTGALLYDADGNGAGAATQIALLGVNLALTNADFVVI